MGFLSSIAEWLHFGRSSALADIPSDDATTSERTKAYVDRELKEARTRLERLRAEVDVVGRREVSSSE